MFQIASSRRYARIPARTHILAHRSARRSDPEQNPLVRTLEQLENGTIPKNMFTNFEHKRLKPKLDIFEKPKNRVHKLTDSNSNGALSAVALSLFAGLLLCCIEQTRLGARVYLFVLTLEKGARRASYRLLQGSCKCSNPCSCLMDQTRALDLLLRQATLHQCSGGMELGGVADLARV